MKPGYLSLSLQEKQNIIYGVDALGTPNLRVASRAFGFTVSTLSRILKEREYLQKAVEARVKMRTKDVQQEECNRRTLKKNTRTVQQGTENNNCGKGTKRVDKEQQTIRSRLPKVIFDNTVTRAILKYTATEKANIRQRLQQEEPLAVSLDLGISVSILKRILKEGKSNAKKTTTTTTTSPEKKTKGLLCRDGFNMGRRGQQQQQHHYQHKRNGTTLQCRWQ
ncbi:hypothetical protein Pmani_006323 [Petrolisthes manimaculis]|uniref:Uncharacterized protein n=1 Tax=Petrolisthes manimaculis TaxID=1843537 RepID=A0AAE1UGK1_9EUCA|nr:hypothetical protein Pmani_006323 [Petrolisthes manimaculis]